MKLFLLPLIFLLTLIIVACCIALLAVRLFFGKAFVKTHVDQSRAMRQRGIHCVQAQDAEQRADKAPHAMERSH